jgi:CelD/BcsL family acetyltransferase involved in cellulose biosynthesis
MRDRVETMRRIAVSVCSPDEDIAEQWASLSGRAAVNVFMCPTALKAAHATGFARVHMLLAWQLDIRPARLVGLWALRDARVLRVGPQFLAAPPYRHAWLSNPVIDPEFMDEVVGAFFDAIEHERRLCKVVRLRYLDADSDSFAAIVRALGARPARSVRLSERERPFVTQEAGRKRTGATRKRMRQDWNRLCAAGTAEIVNDRSEAGARDAFETFLMLEAASWKGAHGTALLSHDLDAVFARRLVRTLAAEAAASVALLQLNGRAIAAQVLLYSGATAYTWRTAFDASFAEFSPGILLVDKLTEQLLAGNPITAIESCSPQGGFMQQLWSGRRATVDLLVELGSGQSLKFAAVKMGARAAIHLAG